MDITPTKKIMSFIFVCVFTFLTGVGLFLFQAKAEKYNSLRSGERELAAATDNISRITTNVNILTDPITKQFYAKPKLIVKTLANLDFNGWDGQPGAFEDGYIISNKIKYGDELPDFVPFISARQMNRADYPEIDDKEFRNAFENYFYYGLDDPKWYWMSIEEIENSDYAYTEFADADLFADITGHGWEIWQSIDTLKEVYAADVIVKDKDDDEFVFWPESLEAYEHNLASIGFDDHVWQTKNGIHLLDNNYYSYFVIDINDNTTALVLVNFSSALKQTAPIVFPIVGLIFIFLFVYIFWAFEICSFVKNVRLSVEQRKKYVPKRVRLITTIYGITGGIIIFLASIYASTLMCLYKVNEDCRKTLKTLFEQVAASQEKVTAYQSVYDDLLITDLTYLAKVLSQHPELLNSHYLQETSAIIGADCLVVYGVDGRQLVTNSALRGLAIGGAGDSDGSFKTLRNGTPSVVRTPIDDGSSSIDMISISYGVPLSFASDQTYGVLAAYVNPKVRNSLQAFDEKDLIRYYTSPTEVSFTADPESETVIFATKEDLIGRKLTEIGMKEGTVRDNFMDFFRLFEDKYYGISEAENDIIYYNAKIQDEMLIGRLPFALVAVVGYTISFIILVRFVMSGYQSQNITWQESGTFFGKQKGAAPTAQSEIKDSTDANRCWNLLERFKDKQTPATRARLLAEILLLILISLGLIYALTIGQEQIGNSSILGYVIYGEWTKGFNIFAFTALLLLCGVIFFCMVIMELIGSVLNRFLDTKGETVARLAINLIRYILIIILVYQGSDFFGFDTRAVIASIGLVSFALSLGLKDMVTDIVAGLTIVFEGEYQVGDIIEIAGFRGKVVEIGVRSTKLKGRGGNIKIISNRDVKNVLNMTHLNSWCAIDVTVGTNESRERLEKIFATELPKIGKKIKGIISGPYYKGVLSFGHAGQTLSIIAECREEDFFKVQRELNRELTSLFDKYDVKL